MNTPIGGQDIHLVQTLKAVANPNVIFNHQLSNFDYYSTERQGGFINFPGINKNF